MNTYFPMPLNFYFYQNYNKYYQVIHQSIHLKMFYKTKIIENIRQLGDMLYDKLKGEK